MTVQELVATIDGNRNHANLSSAIRLFVLGVYRSKTEPAQPKSVERVDALNLPDRVRPL